MWTINISRYLFRRGVRGHDPVVSIDVVSNGATGSCTPKGGYEFSILPFLVRITVLNVLFNGLAQARPPVI